MVPNSSEAEHHNQLTYVTRVREVIGNKCRANQEGMHEVNPWNPTGGEFGVAAERVIEDDSSTHGCNSDGGYHGQVTSTQGKQEGAEYKQVTEVQGCMWFHSSALCSQNVMGAVFWLVQQTTTDNRYNARFHLL